MKRFLTIIALACALSTTALAGDSPTDDGTSPGNIPTSGFTSQGNIPTSGIASPGDIPSTDCETPSLEESLITMMLTMFGVL